MLTTDILVAVVIGFAIFAFLVLLQQNAPKTTSGEALVKPSSPVAVSNGAAADSSSKSTSSPKSTSPKLSKAEAKKRAKEEAEEDAFVQEELRRSGGVRKDKLERLDLNEIASKRANKQAGAERRAEGAAFSERQAEIEKASGFQVVGRVTDKKEVVAGAKKDKAAKRASPKQLTRNDELDAALRSVLNKRKGRGGGGGGRGGRGDGDDFGSRGDNERRGGNGPVSPVIDIKGEVKKVAPGGHWNPAQH